MSVPCIEAIVAHIARVFCVIAAEDLYSMSAGKCFGFLYASLLPIRGDGVVPVALKVEACHAANKVGDLGVSPIKLRCGSEATRQPDPSTRKAHLSWALSSSREERRGGIY